MLLSRGAAAVGRAALRNRQGALIGLLLIACVALSLGTSTFLTTANLRTVALGGAIDLVLVAGQAMVIIAGGFDLSIGSVMGLSAVIIGLLMADGITWWLATIVAVVVAGLCGTLNGILIAWVGVNPLIATLGTLFAYQGIALVVTQSATVFASGTLVNVYGQGIYGGVPTPVWIALVIIIVAAAVMRWFRFGREIFFVGGNADAARLAGIAVQRVRLMTYIVMGCLAGLAGALALGRVGTANADTGANEELNVIAAAVIGGASLAGGEGSIVGAALGVLLIQVVEDAVVLLNVSVFWQQLVVGVVLVVAVALNVVTAKVRDRLSVRAALAQFSALAPLRNNPQLSVSPIPLSGGGASSLAPGAGVPPPGGDERPGIKETRRKGESP